MSINRWMDKVACMLSCVWHFLAHWTVACQAPLSLGFSRQEYWNVLPFPTPGYPPKAEIKPVSLASPALAGRFFTTSTTGKTSSVQFSRSVVSDSLRPHEQQHARPPCPSPSPRACSNSCPLNQWCHPIISPSIIPFSSCLQSFPTSGLF